MPTIFTIYLDILRDELGSMNKAQFKKSQSRYQLNPSLGYSDYIDEQARKHPEYSLQTFSDKAWEFYQPSEEAAVYTEIATQFHSIQ